MESNSITPVSSQGSQAVQGIEHNANLVQIPSFVIETVGSEHGNEEIELREYVGMVLRNKSIVVIVTILLTIIPAFYIFTAPRVYQSEAKIQIDSENQPNLNGTKASSSTFDDRAYFNTQLKLLKNPKLLRNIIKDNDLSTNKVFLNENFMDPDLLLSIRSTKALPGNANNVSKTVDSDAIEVAEAERLNPFVEAIQMSLSVQPVLQPKQTVKDTRLISVKFKHPDPAIAKLVANAIADELVEHNLNSTTNANSSERDYLKNNIADLRSQIRSSEQQILRYGRQYQLPSEGDEQNTVVERLVGLNRQLLEAENSRKLAEAKYKASLAPGASEALADTGAKDITDINAKLDDLRQKRAQLLVEVTEKHPDALAIDKQIAVLEKAANSKRVRAVSNFKTTLSVSYKQNVALENSIRKSYKRQWEKLTTQNGAAINYRIIQQELETNRKLLDEMQRREKESEMLTAKAPNNIRVVEYALTPREPVNQQRLAYFGLVILASFSIGIAGALIRDYFGDSANSTGEIVEQLGLPLAASVPEIAGNSVKRTRRLDYRSPSILIDDVEEESLFENGDKLIVNRNGKSTLEDALQHHRTILQLSPDIGDTRNLLITSSHGVDGQSAMLINIAENLARTGASVLIVDADLRDPKIHRILGCSNERGLSNLLTEKFYKKHMRNLFFEVSENLHFLPSGPIPYNCSESLGSNRTKDLMSSLNANFDYVIIDSPPVFFFADSSILARNVDGVLLVVEESSDSLQELEQTRRFLTRTGGKIVGVVLEPGEKQSGIA